MTGLVFISYSDEVAAAKSLMESLRQHELDAFSFRHTPTRPGHDFDFDIKEKLSESFCLVLLWNTKARQSNWVAREIGLAAEQRKHVIPVMTAPKPALPDSLAHIQAVMAHENSSGWVGDVTREVVKLAQEKGLLRTHAGSIGLGCGLGALIGIPIFVGAAAAGWLLGNNKR